MIFDFLQIDKGCGEPVYRQIYSDIKNHVENGSLKKGVKLPSIRVLSDTLKVSKNTVEAAYNQLCIEGYIINKPQRGYFVNAEIKIIQKKQIEFSDSKSNANISFEYDFGSRKIEQSSANIKLWKKYVKDVLNCEYLINQYGSTSGELTLRKSLQRYAFSVRGVNTGYENIVVGAGTQPLMYMLCGLLGQRKKVAIEKGTYIQAERVFKDCGYDVLYLYNDENTSFTEQIDKLRPDVMLINPNFNSSDGGNMPIEERINLINKASQIGCLIIEDDYNGELRYNTNPVPCVQSYDCENVVYIGSFSKTLLPSVRISYLVLPEKLLKVYNKVSTDYNQTASKIEQLALSKYLDDGKFEKHLKNTRKALAKKSKIMLDLIFAVFGKNTKVMLNETSLFVFVKTDTMLSNDEIFNVCSKNKINIIKSNDKRFNFILSFSGIETDKIEQGLRKIKTLL